MDYRPQASLDHDDPIATVTISLDAEVDAVWRALTTNQGLAPWMGEGASIGFAPGDPIVMPDPVGGKPRRGQIDDRIENERFAFTWWPEDDDGQSTRVSITLTSTEAGTDLTVTETLPTAVRACTTVSSASSDHQAAWLWRVALLAVALAMVLAQV